MIASLPACDTCSCYKLIRVVLTIQVLWTSNNAGGYTDILYLFELALPFVINITNALYKRQSRTLFSEVQFYNMDFLPTAASRHTVNACKIIQNPNKKHGVFNFIHSKVSTGTQLVGLFDNVLNFLEAGEICNLKISQIHQTDADLDLLMEKCN